MTVGRRGRTPSTRTALAGIAAALLATALTACGSDPSDARGTEPPATASSAPARPDGVRLIEVAGAGDLIEVRRLLAAGADVGFTDQRGRTALIAAAYGAHLDVARALIDAGADVNVQDVTKQSAYLIATSEIGEPDGLALLELTLAHGADVRTTDSYNGTGLIRAAHRGYAAIVRRLLQAGTDPNHVNGLRWTALLEAIVLGDGGPRHTEVVRHLVEGGADVNLADGDGARPLALARRRNQANVVALLEAAGARGD